MARPAFSGRRTSRARTRRSTRTRARTRKGCRSSSSSSRSPDTSAATRRRRRPARSTKAASSATACRTRYGMAFDNPDVIVACVVGDGEAETGPLATAWHSNKFVNPMRDGAVLPILNLNGYKIANPTILARISHEELESLFVGLRLQAVLRRGQRSGRDAPEDGGDARTRDRRHPRHPAERRARPASASRPRWPMIVLRITQGLDRARRSRRAQARGLLARRTRSRSRTCATTRRT